MLSFGISKWQITWPLPFVLIPDDLVVPLSCENDALSGLVYWSTLIPSKYMKWSVFGFRFVPVILISLLLIKGITDTLTTLLFLVSTKSSTTDVLTPVLACISGVSVISFVIIVPCVHVPPWAGSPDQEPGVDACVSVSTTVGSPTHVVCHAFQTVPSEFWFSDNTASKLPSLFILTSGNCSVSFHMSDSGSNFILPINANTWYGFTFICLDALSWFTYVTSVNGNVIKSPVFAYPDDCPVANSISKNCEYDCGLRWPTLVSIATL